MTIKETLSWVICSNWPLVIIESDCLVDVQAIKSKMPIKTHFGGIVENCRKYLKDNNNIQLYFIKRSVNMVAHELARVSYSYPDRNFHRSWLINIGSTFSSKKEDKKQNEQMKRAKMKFTPHPHTSFSNWIEPVFFLLVFFPKSQG